MTVLELRDVHRTHGNGDTAVHALRGVCMNVCAGELVAVDGLVLGALPRRRLAEVRRRGVGYVFQSFNLLPSLTAAENVALPLELDGVPVRKARREALRSLADLDLTHLADRFPDEMSGGQQQRVAIAGGATAVRPAGDRGWSPVTGGRRMIR